MAPHQQGLRVTDSSGHRGGDDLDRKIAEAQAKHERGLSTAEGRAESRGWAVGIEFVGTVLVCAFIGWGIDRWVGSKVPWGLIVMLLLGFAAGTRRALGAREQARADALARTAPSRKRTPRTKTFR